MRSSSALDQILHLAGRAAMLLLTYPRNTIFKAFLRVIPEPEPRMPSSLTVPYSGRATVFNTGSSCYHPPASNRNNVMNVPGFSTNAGSNAPSNSGQPPASPAASNGGHPGSLTSVSSGHKYHSPYSFSGGAEETTGILSSSTYFIFVPLNNNSTILQPATGYFTWISALYATVNKPTYELAKE